MKDWSSGLAVIFQPSALTNGPKKLGETKVLASLISAEVIK